MRSPLLLFLFAWLHLSCGWAAATGIGLGAPGWARPVHPFLAEGEVTTLSKKQGDWILRGLECAAFLLGIAWLVKELRRPAPKIPLEVRGPVTFVPDHEFKEFAEYVHDRNHKFAGELTALSLKAEERRLEQAEQTATIMAALAELGEKLDGKRSATAADLYGQLKAAERQIERATTNDEAHNQRLIELDRKVTTILERLPRRNS